MKVLQLIDTLNAGGAEKVAVNYANILSNKHSESHLITTRASGILQSQLKDSVNYKNLNKKKVFDFKAIKSFRKYLRIHDIQIVHAHTTSYFFAVLLKLLYPKFKLIWHDHQGNRDEIASVKQIPLILCSFFFSGVICVNKRLEIWAKKRLFCNKVLYIENFVLENNSESDRLILKGENGKRIVNVANLKPPKNHLQLLKAFHKVHKIFPDWSLHLVGKDFNDNYSAKLRNYIQSNNLEDNIFIYGLRDGVNVILKQCDIGIIASTYEGLPMALLEYGMAGLSIVTTNVGNCKELVEGKGLVVEKNDEKKLTNAIVKLIQNKNLREIYSNDFKDFIDLNFSKDVVSKKIVTFYKQITQ